jgi:hypothetical protein
MNEREFPRYELLRAHFPVAQGPGFPLQERIEDRGGIEPRPSHVADRHPHSSRPLLERTHGVRAATVEVAATLRGLGLGQEDDVRLALETAAKLVDWAEGRLHDATANDSTGTPVSRSISSANDSEGFRRPRAMSER